MLHLKSSEETVNAAPERVFDFLTKFSNAGLGSVPGITDVHTSDDGFSFTVQGIRCELTLSESTPFSNVSYRANTDKNLSASVSFKINPVGGATALQADIDIDVPFFLQGMIKGVASKFVDTGMTYLKTAIENY